MPFRSRDDYAAAFERGLFHHVQHTMPQDSGVHEDDLPDSSILLVEDNEEDILLLKRAFRNARIANSLNVVKDGDQAIRYLGGSAARATGGRRPVPFLILLDLRLPKLSGFEVLEWIRERAELAGVIVVVLTNSDHVPDVSKARELGANSYLVKPGTFDELVAMVKRIRGRWLLVDGPHKDSVSTEASRSL
jgi:DNA-binding response OmpR family regulator